MLTVLNCTHSLTAGNESVTAPPATADRDLNNATDDRENSASIAAVEAAAIEAAAAAVATAAAAASEHDAAAEPARPEVSMSFRLEASAASTLNLALQEVEEATQSRSDRKPPYTYTDLITQALKDKTALTVSGIYQWIT